MTKKILPTPKELRQLLRYEPETGKFFWKERPVEMFSGKSQPPERIHANWSARFLGKEAFTSTNQDGYKESHVRGKCLRAHRVAWAIYYGEWPKGEIDHINGVRDDNRIANLRDSEHCENMRNGLLRADNKSGLKGVSWDSESNRWRAQIMANGKKKNLGRFDCPNAAHAAYCEAAKKYHGEFARLK